MSSIKTIVLLALGFVLSACVSVPDAPEFQASSERPPSSYQSFDEYVALTREYIDRNRVFISENRANEVAMNAPREWRPKNLQKPQKGVLLVHGLGDSPFSFHDLAERLTQQGFIVRTVLLEGHGTRPGDLSWVSSERWYAMVERHVALLESEVDHVWLGGFSTGANLVTRYAVNDPSIEGLLLFSPAFVPKRRSVALAPFISNFATWVDVDPNDNLAKYDSLTFQAAGAYYETSRDAHQALVSTGFDRPALLVGSESDSVVDMQEIAAVFQSSFTHPDSRFVWYGLDRPISDTRLIRVDSLIPEMRVSNISHMAPLFAPSNSYYGVDGEYRLCNNGQGEAEALCYAGEQVWYSAYGLREIGKVHARLTWNPHFDAMVQQIESLVHE